MREVDLGDLGLNEEEQELLRRMEPAAGPRRVYRPRLWWAIAIVYLFVVALGLGTVGYQNQPAAEVPRAPSAFPQITPGVQPRTSHDQEHDHDPEPSSVRGLRRRKP